jgi:hypothetical protein
MLLTLQLGGRFEHIDRRGADKQVLEEGMSVKCTRWVWEHSDRLGIDATTLLVLLFLADEMWDKPGMRSLSRRYISRSTTLSVRAVSRSIGVLEGKGLLSAQKRFHQASVYALHLPPTNVPHSPA